MRAVFIVAAFLVLVTACANEDPGTEAPPTATATPLAEEQPTATVTPVPSPSPVPPTVTPTRTPSFDPGSVIIPTVTIPTSTTVPTSEHPQERELDQVAARTAVIRNLFPKKKVDRHFITRAELRDNLVGLLEDDREDIQLDQKLFQALRLIGPELDLYGLQLDLLTEGVLGYFDLENEDLFVIKDKAEFSPGDMLTYSHEVTHSLQQQHYDLLSTRRQLEDNQDGSTAFTALLEGDATMIEAIYMFQHMDDLERQQATEESQSSFSGALLDAPWIVRRTLVFPYLEGFQFVQGLLSNFGWQAIDDAYAVPPSSTEHILHADKYLSGEAPVEIQLPDLAASLGNGWTEIRRNNLGEFFLRTYLETGVQLQDASLASTGWGGDRYALLESLDGELAVALMFAWDTEQDAQEFFDIFLEYVRVVSELEWEALDESGARRRIALPGQTIYIGRAGLETLLVMAPDIGTNAAIVGAFDAAAVPASQ